MKRRRVIGLLLVPVLSVSLVLAGLVFLSFTERGFRRLARMAVDLSGGALAIEKVQGRLVDQWQLDGVRVQTPAADLLIRKLVLQWRPLALLHGTMRIATLHGQGVEVRIKDEPGDAPFVLPELLLPMGVALESVDLEDLAIQGLSDSELPHVERISLELAAGKRHLHLKRVEAKIPGASVSMQGNVELGNKWPLELRGNVRVEEKGGAPLAADFVIGGTVLDLVAQVDLQTPVQTRVNLACSDPFGELRWQVDTVLEQVKLAEMYPEWPDLVLTAVDLRASGTLDGYQGTVQLEGEQGQAESWARLASLPRTPVRAEFAGDFSGLRVSSLVAQLAEGSSVTARGAVNWQDGLNWQAELEGKDVDLEPYFPAWQGHVNTRLNTSGRLQGEDFSAEMQIVELDGDLLGSPLSGSGTVIVDSDGLQVRDVLLRSGETELGVTGTVGAGDKENILDLRVQLDVANLGHLLPEAGGTAHFQGAVQGSRKTPQFSFDLEADGLSYQDHKMQTLTGSGQGIFTPQGEMDVQLAGKGLRVGPAAFTAFTMDLGGTMARHQVLAKLSGVVGDIDVELAGGVKEVTVPSWQGELRHVSLHLDPYGDWRLRNPTPLGFNAQGIDLASACFEQGGTKVCLEGGWQPSNAMGTTGGSSNGQGSWRLNGDLDSFACEQLYRWHLLSRPVQGRLAASVRTTGEGTRLMTGEARLSAPELQIPVQDEDGREQLLRWADNLLTLELADSKLVSMAGSRFQDNSTIDALITVDGFGELFSSWQGLPMQGQIGLDVKELAPLAVLSNYMVKPTGSMKGTFAVSGQVGNPRLSGELRQATGSVFIPATGITLEQLLLSVMVKGEGEGMHLVLDAASGPGKIRIAGDVTREEQEGWQVDAAVTGKEFEVAHLPEYEIVIDPDLRVVLRKGVVQVNGKVLAPRAAIVIKEVDESVTASRDVILLDGEEEGKKKDLPLSGAVIVELGDEVTLDAFGLKGRVSGSVAVSDAPGLPLVGKGSLTLHDGIYVIRDRALDISRGRFFFVGTPLDNPGIDVLAQKKSKKKTVGVLVSGTVNDMDLKLFSDPPMAESQILTELLAGRSYSETSHQVSNTVGAVATTIGLERGGAFVGDILSRLENQLGLDSIYVENGEKSSDVSVMIGKELFDDLYVSYGYDPFSAAGIFKARYDLWNGFSVETEVGAEKTGADLLWSIEK